MDLTTDRKLYANQQYLTLELNTKLSRANTRSEAFLPLHPKDLLCEAANNEQKAVKKLGKKKKRDIPLVYNGLNEEHQLFSLLELIKHCRAEMKECLIS